MALAAKRARTLLHLECDSTVARAPRSQTRRSLATLVKHANPRTILHGEQHVREPAMKVFMFHLMPYAYLDMNYTD
jgi:hypothetical protein